MTTTIYKTFQDMGNIFSDLSRLSDKYWRNKRTLDDKEVPNDISEIYQDLKERNRQITEKDIEKLFRDNRHICKLDFKDFNNLYLPPLENDNEFVPILSMECDLNDHLKISLRVEMQGYDKDKKNYIGFGFRFESPHWEGNHKYWHVQVITENNGRKLGCSPWLPVQDPCIPVKIKKPIDLILFMLISFYGSRGQILIDNMNIDKKYRKPVDDIFSLEMS